MARPGIMVYFSILEPLMMLSDEDKGRLFVAMLTYGKDGVVPEFSGPLGIAWSFVQPTIDKDGQRYDDMRLQREYAIFCKKRKKIWMPKILFEDWVLMSDEEKKRALDPVASRVTVDNGKQRAITGDNEPITGDNEPITGDNERKPITVTSTSGNIQSQSPVISLHSPLDSLHSPLYSSQLPVISNQSTSNSNQQSTNKLQLTSDEDGGSDDCGGDGGTENVVKVLEGKLGKGVVFLSDAQISDLLDKMDIDTFDHYVDKLSSFIIKNDAKVKNHYETILKWWKQDALLRE